MQRWGKDYLRRRLDWTLAESEVNASPRHLSNAYCPCQYAEEILLQKFQTNAASQKSKCTALNNWCRAKGFEFCWKTRKFYIFTWEKLDDKDKFRGMTYLKNVKNDR